MAHLVLAEEDYQARFGPTPAFTPASGWDSREPDKLVKTHCRFCDVQCGIQLQELRAQLAQPQSQSAQVDLAELERLRSEHAELMRLRGQVTQLSHQLAQVTKTRREPGKIEPTQPERGRVWEASIPSGLRAVS